MRNNQSDVVIANQKKGSLERLRLHENRERELDRVLSLKPSELELTDIITLRNAFAPFSSANRDVAGRLWALDAMASTVGNCVIADLRSAFYDTLNKETK